MIERQTNKLFVNKWVRKGLRFAVATIITAASFVSGINPTRVNSEVGSLTTEPILLILDPDQIHDLLQYKPLNLGSIGPRVEVSPEFFVRLADTEGTLPEELTLWTRVSKEGPAKVCAYTYQKPQTCQEILGTDIIESWYPIKTGVLKQPGDYIEATSARIKTEEGTGKVKIEMEITDDRTKGLLSSASTILSLLDRQVYIPSIRKGISLDKRLYLPHIQQGTFLELLNSRADSQASKIIPLQRRMRERVQQKRAA